MEKKGFFSLDAVFAIIITALFLAVPLLTQFEEQPTLTKVTNLQQANDIIVKLDRNGTILSIVDQNIPVSTQLQNIDSQFRQLLPEKFDLRLEMKSFSTKNTGICRQNQDFQSCLIEDFSSSYGSAIPTDKDIISRKLFFAKKRPIQSCSFGAELAGGNWVTDTRGKNLSFKSGPLENMSVMPASFLPKKLELPKLSFASHEFGGIINFTVDLNGTTFLCDEHIRVDLNSFATGGRAPIDLMLVIDRSGSMSWNGRTNTGSSNHLWLDGNFAFHVNGGRRVRDINVENPLDPNFITTFDPGSPRDIHGFGNTVYVIETSGTDELFSYDISNPLSPSQSDRISINSPDGVFALGDFVYVVVDTSGTSNDILRVVDATDPGNLVLRGSINLSSARDVFVKDNIAYVARRSEGLSTVDVTDPDNLLLLDTHDPGGTLNGVYVEGNLAFVAIFSSGVGVYDVTDPGNIVHRSTFNTPGSATNLFAVGNLVYVADGTSLYILDATDPDNLVHDRNFPTTYDYDDVFVRGNYAYLSSSLGFITVDVIDGPRINNAKVAANTLLDHNGWVLPPDQLGLVSYSSTSTLDEPLTSIVDDVKSEVAELFAGGGTNIESGIRTATTELTGNNSSLCSNNFKNFR